MVLGPRTESLQCQVRCNSRQPCENCSQTGILCTYDAVPQRKGPKGSRAKIISELRQTHKKAELSHSTSGSQPGSPRDARTSGLLTQEINEQCIDFFFVHIYPTMPVFTRDQMKQTSIDMDQSTEAYCLLCSLSAFIMIQPGMEQTPCQPGSRSPSPSTNAALGILLMEEAIRVRKAFDYVEAPSVASIITSFFLFGCCLGLNKHNTAWIHLREATALTQILGMQDENTYLRGDPVESSLKRRLFWLLFVTERYTFELYSCLQESADSVALGYTHCRNTDPSRCTQPSNFQSLISIRRIQLRASAIWSTFTNPSTTCSLVCGTRLGQIARRSGSPKCNGKYLQRYQPT